MRVVEADELTRLIDYPTLIDAIRAGFSGSIFAPPRHHHSLTRAGGAQASLILMPAWDLGRGTGDTFMGVKLVSVFPDNAQRGKPSVHATYVLMCGETGEPLACLHGQTLTLLRTAATSALAASALARGNASRLVMIGAGALAPHLVAAHGGSLSGEHGDGRARSELLPVMYSPAAIGAFEAFKDLLDPRDLLNPGVLVRPRPLDADLRRPHARPLLAAPSGFAFPHDAGDFTTAVHRCVGVGKCRSDTSAAGGFMCPSYLATREEKDSTRGRARVLQEMVDGRLVGGGFAAPEVHAALDLCLSCKGCASDCPTGVDMATYKSEVLYQTYRGRRRPRSHYVLGRLPVLARLTAPVARMANAGLRLPGVVHLARWAAGVDQRRSLPAFATRRFGATVPAPPAEDPTVVLWADTFTEYFATGAGRATVALLEAAGHRVRTLARPRCCGLTWITTGQLDTARTKASELIDQLHPYCAAGTFHQYRVRVAADRPKVCQGTRVYTRVTFVPSRGVVLPRHTLRRWPTGCPI